MNQPALILAVFYAVGVILGDLFVVPIFTLFIVLFIFGFLGLGVHGLARRLSTVVGKQDYHASSLDCVYGLCEIARVVLLMAIVVHDCNFPVTERASADWLEQLQSSGAQVFSVRKLGGIRLTVKPGDWRLEDSQGILFSR